MNLSTIIAIGIAAAAQTSPAPVQTSPAATQNSPTAKTQEPAPATAITKPRSAHQAVHDGNQQLLAGKASAALEAYKQAEQLVPDAREIAFVAGLAHFDLEDYEAARDAFHRVGAFDADALADDALYSLGACDHVEALGSVEENPQLALSQLETAMQRYQDLLARRPDHEHARGANYKAASMWRELKRQMEQQQQEKQDCDKEGDEENEQDKQDQEKSQDQKDQQEEEQDKQSQQNEQEQSDQQKEEQQQASDQQEEKDEKQQQQAEAQKKEQVSREQAQRKLREMMQALRDRKKQRRQQVQKIPVTPVDKDW